MKPGASSRRWMFFAFAAVLVLALSYALSRRRCLLPGKEDCFQGIPERGFFPRQSRPPRRNNPARAFGEAIADTVERVMPSVVVIRTESFRYQLRQDPFGMPLFMVRKPVLGEGSGVIIDGRGYILTTRHILAGAHQIEVILNDGTHLPARLVGEDRAADLAVLKIDSPDGKPFPAIEFGDSDAVRVGEVAIAIGSPFSLQSSVTVGHVSQKGRRVEILPYEDFIQTDAAINEGNSGGPLIDADGRLIGINTAIKTDEEQRAVGIAFAIPSNLAMVIARSIIETGVHRWPWVGAFFDSVDPRRYGAGVLVKQVWRDTPAARAGLIPGDLVTAVNGQPVHDKYDVYRIIFTHAVGDRLRFDILRNGKKKRFVLPLEEFPRQP